MASPLDLIFRITADSLGAQAQITQLATTIRTQVAGIQTSSVAGFGAAGVAATGFGTSLSALVAPLTLVAGAAAILTAGLAFMIKGAVDTENELYSLSQKTQLSAESLSALDVAAQRNDSSVQKLSAGLVIFDKNLSKANTGTDVASKVIRSMGLSLTDNNKALTEAFTKINSYADGGNKAALATQLWGRSGAEMLKVIKESNGDLETYKQKLADLGVLITGPMADGAHKFEEQVKDLQNQFGSLFRAVAQEVMPGIIVALHTATDWIQEHKGEIKDFIVGTGGFIWEWIVKPIVAGVQALKETYDWLAMLPRMIAKTSWGSTLMDMVGPQQRSQEAAYTMPGMAQASQMGWGSRALALAGVSKPQAPALPKGGKGGRGTKPKKTPDDQGREGIQALEESNRALVESQRAANDDLKAAYDKGNKDREDYYTEARLQVKIAMEGELANIEQEKFIAQTRIKDAKKRDDEIKKLDDEAQKVKDTAKKENRKLDAQQDKDALSEQINFLKQKDETLKYYEDRQMAAAEDAFNRARIYEGDLEQLKYEQRDAQLARRLELLQKEQEAWGQYSEQYKKLAHDEEMIDLQRLDAKRDYYDKLNQLVFKEDFGVNFDAGKQGGATGGLDQEIMRLMKGVEPPKPPNLSLWKATFLDLKQTAVSAFTSITQGMQGMIQSFLMGAATAPGAFAAMAKGIIAGLAAQAIVHSIMEVAYGISELAKAAANPLGAAAHAASAHLHFAAAIKFGIVGGVAAVASLAIPSASNSTAQTSGGTSATTTNASGSPTTVVTNRTGEQSVPTSHQVIISLQDGLVAKHIQNDYALNGPIRLLINSDGVKV